MNIRQKIRAYLVENFLLGDSDGLTDSQSLLASGVLDSTGVIELAMFLEQTFQVEVTDEDMAPENFDSIEKIVAFTERRAAAAGHEAA